ncbi:MAG: UDP-N-acetylglucosamine 1-carboxyvinyltransferase [Rhodopirellula sp.]|nr:UDP-N-acetylglucosamine 1-carboxyvinyltransferase [Rhodopirellula sp.]
MDMFVVRGGRPLKGRVRVSGAKNAALPIMAASLMADGPITLHDVPDLVDVQTLSQLLGTLGVATDRQADDSLRLEVFDDSPVVADYELVRRMRASICVLGPLLARRGRATVSLPGGCNIGDRPIDLHLKGLKALGADIRIERGYVIASAKRLRGGRVFLGGSFGSTVTGTCNVMAAAALADGVTTIESAACEPEVADYGRLLNAMGARIEGLGTPFLRIEGVKSLSGAEHHVIPDRIEAATLLIAGAITHGDVVVENVCTAHLSAVLDKLNDVGVGIEIAEDAGSDRSTLHVLPVDRLTPTECSALPYPGLPTDVQAQFMALLSRADGISVVTDKVFPDRFMHVAELVRLGASIHREGQSAIISGTNRLHGACVMASDLRASAALVLAAMAADGESVIRRIYHLDRGYEQLEKRLNSLGADIRRVEDCSENVPASLSLTQPVSSAGSLTTDECSDPAMKLDEGRQLRFDEAETLSLPQSPAKSKANHDPMR